MALAHKKSILPAAEERRRFQRVKVHLLGRYMSIFGLSFTLSQALGPAIGGLLLQTSPDAVWWGGALAALLAGAVLLRLGGRIPDPFRDAQSGLVPAPEPA